MACRQCNTNPCLLSTHREMLEKTAEVSDTDLPSNAARHALYRAFTAAEHGYLGRGNRIVVPECVRNFIRELFPDEGGKYTGHRDSTNSNIDE